MFQKKVVQKIKTHILCSITFSPENRANSEIMWKNMVRSDRPTDNIWRMRLAYCMTKAADTRPEYVMLIAFPRQQWLRERVSV
jgi:hypothetical protein